MAPLNKVQLSLYFLFCLFTSTLISSHQIPPKIPQKRLLLSQLQEDEQPIIKNKKTNQTTKATPSKNQTTTRIKPSINSSKNKTKLIKSNPSNSTSPPIAKSLPKKLNTTSISTPKINKTTAKKDTKAQLEKGLDQAQPNKAQKKPNPIVAGDDDDLVADFRDLPTRFQESFVPDFERFTKSSQVYLSKYNKEFAKGFKPYVGKRYAPAVASAVSFGFIVIPLILVSLIFNRIKAYFSLQRLLIFIQIYLAIYFTILSLSAVATGLEPLRFFYAASKSTYVCVQVMQTLAYVLYLLLLLMYLVLVFSTDTVLATKFLGLGQTLVAFAVGLHYYITVFHRTVLGSAPKTSWKAHGLYATCFIVICLLGRVDRRKKAYLEDGGEEGKQS